MLYCPRCGNLLVVDGTELTSWCLCDTCQYSNNILAVKLKTDKIRLEDAIQEMMDGGPGPYGATLQDLWYLQSAGRLRGRADRMGDYTQKIWEDFGKSMGEDMTDAPKNVAILSISRCLIDNLPGYYTRCAPFPWGEREPSGLNMLIYRRHRECIGWCSTLQFPGEKYRDMRWYVHVADNQIHKDRGYLSYRMQYIKPGTELLITDSLRLYLQMMLWIGMKKLKNSEDLFPMLILWDREAAIRTLFQYPWSIRQITMLSDQKKVLQDVCTQMRACTPLKCCKFRTLTDTLTGGGQASYRSAEALDRALETRSVTLDIKPQHPSLHPHRMSTVSDEHLVGAAAELQS